ncbi:MAG: Cas10/Cmr2 second palm domain-containing protein [Pseudonocardia sp.]
MKTYLDIGVARIQTWLGRSSTLRGRRGASRLLADQTRRGQIESWLLGQPGLADVSWNEQSGDVDGIVNLTLSADTPPERTTQVAAVVIGWLRDGLPRVDLQAAWTTADSYVEAYPDIEAVIDSGDGLIVDLAPSRGVPIARVCDDCGLDSVVRADYHIAEDEVRDLCADCEARYDGAGRTTGRTRTVVPGPETDLAEWLVNDSPAWSGYTRESVFQQFPDNFGELATATTGPDDRPGTHTALVYADGNQVGAFIERAIEAGLPKSDLAKWISRANRAAVVAGVNAVLTTHPASAGIPVSPHLIAGDDLLVSLPAMLAWPFLRAYLPAFTEALRKEALKCQEALKCEASRNAHDAIRPFPTVSAGLVIAHQSYPFADVVALAGAALATAKRHTRGAASSVAWLDITAHGPGGAHTSVLTDAVSHHVRELGDLAAAPASTRQTLLAAVGGADLAGARRPDLDDQIRRLDIEAARPFLDDGAAAAAGLPLPVALSLVRWWR